LYLVGKQSADEKKQFQSRTPGQACAGFLPPIEGAGGSAGNTAMITPTLKVSARNLDNLQNNENSLPPECQRYDSGLAEFADNEYHMSAMTRDQKRKNYKVGRFGTR
jgi:hypothetical protein